MNIIPGPHSPRKLPLSLALLALATCLAVRATPATRNRPEDAFRAGNHLLGVERAVEQAANRGPETDWTAPATLRTLLQAVQGLVLSHRLDAAHRGLALVDSLAAVSPAAGDSLRVALLHWGSRLAKRERDSARARRLNRQALAVAARGTLSLRLRADLLRQRGNLLRVARRYAAAEPFYRRALALRRAAPDATPVEIAGELVWLGLIVRRQERWEESDSLLAAAGRLLERAGLPDHPLQRVILENRLYRLLERGEPPADSLAARWRRTLRSWVRQRETPFGGSRGAVCSPLVAHLLHAGRPASAWQLLEEGLGLSAQEGVVLAQRFPRATGDTVAAAGAAPAAWLARVRRENRRLRAEQRVLAQSGWPWPADPNRVRRSLAPGEVLLGGVRLPADPTRSPVSPRELWAYLIARDRPLRWVRLISDPGKLAALDADQQRILSLLRTAAQWPLPVLRDTVLERLAARVADRLLAPLAPLPPGTRTVFVLPGWCRVPAEFLPLPDGERLGDRYGVASLPSAMTLVLLRETAGNRPGWAARPSLVIAGGGALPGTCGEAHAVARRLPLPVVLDARSPRAWDRLWGGRLERFGVIHLASHAWIDPVFPERSCLVLPGRGGAADRRITASRIAERWRLDGALVVLSACATRTGRGETGYLAGRGFMQALLRAGARALILSRWPVDDDATALFMAAFAAALADSTGEAPGRQDAAAALRAARRAVRRHRDRDGRRPYVHPSYWAGFTLVGDPRPAPTGGEARGRTLRHESAATTLPTAHPRR